MPARPAVNIRVNENRRSKKPEVIARLSDKMAPSKPYATAAF